MSTTQAKYFWGIDCGSTEIKVVVCDAEGNVLHQRKTRTLFPVVEHVRKALTSDEKLTPFESDGKTLKDEHLLTATGYGRNSLGFAQNRLTEIKAHFLGVHRQLGFDEKGEPYTIVDIGGQDSKVITVRKGDVYQFVINRKCAAGTGAFIEELAHRLEIPLADLAAIEKRHDRKLLLNSYCTVFAGQEVIKVLMNGEKVENLIHALYESVVKRVLEMTAITTDVVAFSGGVMKYHAPLLGIFAERLPGKQLIIAPEAQFCGALGAALHGIRGQ